jgi:hypothetical protein
VARQDPTESERTGTEPLGAHNLTTFRVGGGRQDLNTGSAGYLTIRDHDEGSMRWSVQA